MLLTLRINEGTALYQRITEIVRTTDAPKATVVKWLMEVGLSTLERHSTGDLLRAFQVQTAENN